MTIYFAKPGRRRIQIKTFYDSLKRRPSGRLERSERERWLLWLQAFDIGESRAKQIMRSDEMCPQSIDGRSVSRAISLLERSGYVVTPKK